MPSISIPTAILGAGAVGGISSLIGGVVSSGAATDAAKLQSDAAKNAAANQLAEFLQTRSDLSPFREAGATALETLQGLTGTNPGGNPLTAPLTKPFTPTLETLRGTPGYQFVLDQGLESTQNAFAAKGLASSGAALKGAASYAEGLAGTTYQSQFNNYLAQNQQIYKMLSDQATLGEGAAVQTGVLGTQNVNAANALTTSAAAAGAGGIVGSANALNSAIGGIGGSASNTALLLALNRGGLFGKTASAIPSGIPQFDDA